MNSTKTIGKLVSLALALALALTFWPGAAVTAHAVNVATFADLQSAITANETDIQITGNFTLTGDITIPNGTILTVNSTRILNIDSAFTLTIASGGTLINNGTINIVNGAIENNAGGTIKNDNSSALYIKTNGKIRNNGTITNSSNGIIENNGDIQSSGDSQSSSTINNDGTLINTKTLTNGQYSTINNSGKIMNHEGSITNSGTIIDPPPNITTSSPLSNGTVGIAYTSVAFAADNPPILGWSQTGTLPAGLVWNGTAIGIEGTPTAAGTFTFKIQAKNARGDHIKAFELTIIDKPGAPTMVSAVAGDGQATVSFAAPADNGGSPITSYTVTSSPDGKIATGAASPLTVTGLTNGTAYTFTVTATNSAGTGPASAASTPPVIPTPAPTPTPRTTGSGGGSSTTESGAWYNPNLKGQKYPVLQNFGAFPGSGTLTGKVDAPFGKFVRLLRGSQVVDASHYTVTEGSTVITLKESYLRTLGSGSHNFTAEFTDGYADLTVTVGGTPNPNTGAWWIIIPAVK